MDLINGDAIKLMAIFIWAEILKTLESNEEISGLDLRSQTRLELG